MKQTAAARTPECWSVSQLGGVEGTSALARVRIPQVIVAARGARYSASKELHWQMASTVRESLPFTLASIFQSRISALAKAKISRLPARRARMLSLTEFALRWLALAN